MSAFHDAFTALTIAAGMSPSAAGELLAKVISESIPRPSAGALRTQRWRERGRHTVTVETPRGVTPKSATSNKTSNLERHTVTLSDSVSASPPLILSPSKKVKEEDRASAAQGYRSFDESVDFSSAEIRKLEAECPLMVNVYGQITHLAESSWMERIEPHGRKRAIINKIKRDQRSAAEKEQRLTTSKQRENIHSIDMEAAHAAAAEQERRGEYIRRKNEEREQRRQGSA